MSAEKFRFTFDPQFNGDADPFISEAVNSRELAEGQLSLIANYTLHLHNVSLMPDYSNYGFLEKNSAGKWEELDEDEL